MEQRMIQQLALSIALATLAAGCSGYQASSSAAAASDGSGSTSGLSVQPNIPGVPVVAVPASLPAPIANLNYKMTFDDEFTTLATVSSGATYDGSKWYNGNEQCCMSDTIGRGTAMYPTMVNGATTNPYTLASGGGLNITLQLVNGTWFSGVMTSVDKNGIGFAQKYGYFEMKAKLPIGAGTWPGFWMRNTTHLTGNEAATGGDGEIDIVEAYGVNPANFCTTFHDWTNTSANLLYDCTGKQPGATTGFHTWGLLWTETTMTVYYDGVQTSTSPTPAVMKQPYYIILDMGIGGGWPTDKTPTTDTLQIQYVRAYAPN